MTKLGLHANRSSPHLVSFVRDTKPRIVKFLDHDFGTVKACQVVSPETMLIGRFFTAGQPYQHPRQDAQDLVRRLLPTADRFRGLYEAWESYNELEPQTPDEAKRFSEFHVHYAEFMHREGLKTIAYNFSTGVPKLELWQYYQDGAEASDYIGLHEYDAPTMDRVHNENLAAGGGGHFLCLRYRRVWDLLRSSARKPIIITECGIDGGVINDTYVDEDGNRVKKLGYKDFARFRQVSVADYMANLAWYDDEMLKDDYLVGATIFCFGADIARWRSFDFGDDDEDTVAAREALKHALQRPLPPLRPVDVFGAHVRVPQTGQPPANQRDPETIPAGIPPMPPEPPEPEPPKPPDPEPLPPEPPPPPEPRPPCAIPVAAWFADTYNADRQLQEALGCPTEADRSLFFAEQHFQNGLMIYRGDRKTIVVLLQWGAYSEFADTWNSEQREGGFVTPPPGLIEPRRGFGKVWREQLGGAHAAIGFATDNERGLTGQIQPCERGILIRNERNEVRILLPNGKWR